MSKTEEELWSRFRVTNYQDLYAEEWDVSVWKVRADLKTIFQMLDIEVRTGDDGLAEAIIKKPGNVLRKLDGDKPLDDKWTYGGKQATKWVVNGATFPTNYELVFAKTSELLSGSGWVGNFWLVEGYFFCFSEGFSNMAGVIFKKDDRDRPIMQILLGEQAYVVYQEKIQQHQWDAINRRLI